MQEISKSPVLSPEVDAGPVAKPARLWWLAAMVAFLALGNVILLPPAIVGIDPPGPGTPSQVLISWEIGSLLAQMLIVAFFAVLGPGGNLPRQGLVWLAAALFTGSFAGGVELASRWDNFNGIQYFLLIPLFAVPAVLCAAQAPLWILRYIARWRTASSGTAQDLGQISIRGMLAATAIVAAVLGLCRLGLTIENMSWGDGRYGQPLPAANWWTGIGIASGVLLAISTVVLPVASMLVLRSRSCIRGVFFAGAYLAGCAIACYVVFSAFTGAWFAEEVYTLFLLVYLSITACLLTSLAIFRWAGYRLWWGRGPVA
jgi:hypothetical protein